MKIKWIKNCYGFDNTSLENMSLSDNNNIVFGPNGTGKSSISQVYLDFKNNATISNKFASDGSPKVNLEIRNCSIEYKNNKWENDSDYDVNRLYIFNKKYLENSFFIQKETIFVGEGIKQYKTRTNRRHEKENDVFQSLKELKDNLSISSKKKLPKEMNMVSKLYTTKKRLVSFLEKKIDKVYKHNEDFNDYFNANKYLLTVNLPRINDLIKLLYDNSKIVMNKPDFQYIKKYMDIEKFTKFVFSFERKLDICPICLKEFNREYDWNNIKKQIEKEKNTFLNKEVTKFIKSELSKYKYDKSTLINDYINILNKIRIFEYDDNLIDSLSRLDKKINDFFKKTDLFLYEEFINENADSVKTYIDDTNFCSEFEKKAISKQGYEIEKKIYKIINDYSLDNLKKYNIIFNNKTFSLEVRINKSNSCNSNLIDLFCESEITSLSILLFVIDVNRNDYSKKTVILDDPVDSTDESIKHKITYLISQEFMNDEDINALILTHKLNFIRLLKFYCDKFFLFYLSEEFKKSHIRIIKKERNILDNHFKLYDRLLYQINSNDLSDDEKKLNLLAMSTTLRDIIDLKKNYASSKFLKFKYTSNYKRLSNDIIHYNPRKQEKINFYFLVKFYNMNSGYELKNNNIYRIHKGNRKLKIKFVDSCTIDSFVDRFIEDYVVKQYDDFNKYFRNKIFMFISIRRLIEKKTYEYIKNNCLIKNSDLKIFTKHWNKIFRTKDLVDLGKEKSKIRDYVNLDIYFESEFYKSISLIIEQNKTLINSIYHPINSSINTFFYNSINEYMQIIDKVQECSQY